MSPQHYEVEVRGREPADFGRGWLPVRVLRAGAFPPPLTFDGLDETRAYVASVGVDLRVVLVTDDGGREVVEPAEGTGIAGPAG